MTTLKKYKLSGEQAGDFEIEDAFLNVKAPAQLIKDYIVAIRENARQWSASTKDRSEVCHTNKKPHAQKKLGRARQGSLASPQYKGGGVVFGPRPKFNQHVRINKKERRVAIRKLIADKVKSGNVLVLEDSTMEAPKTKTAFNFVKSLALTGKILFLGEAAFDEVEVNGAVQKQSIPSANHSNFIKSIRNIPNTNFNLVTNASGYDIAWARNIVVTEKALPQLIEWLKQG